jgi:hypothetical protein
MIYYYYYPVLYSNKHKMQKQGKSWPLNLFLHCKPVKPCNNKATAMDLTCSCIAKFASNATIRQVSLTCLVFALHDNHTMQKAGKSHRLALFLHRNLGELPGNDFIINKIDLPCSCMRGQ